MPIGEALVYAERYRGEGRLLEAEAVCRQMLEAQPNVPEAEHLLGRDRAPERQTRRGDRARAARDQACAAGALFHANLGEMFRLAGRPKLAVEEARRALEIEPGHAGGAEQSRRRAL